MVTTASILIKGLRHIYSIYYSMEDVVIEGMNDSGILRNGISHLRQVFFTGNHEKRTEKHFADVVGGAAGKRINMFLQIIKVAD